MKLDETALEMAQVVLHEAVINERALITWFADRVEERETRLFVSKILQVNALDLIGEVNHASP